MTDALIDVLSRVPLVWGLFRFHWWSRGAEIPRPFHSLARHEVTETLGAGLLLLGMLTQAPDWLVAIKVVLLVGSFVTSPTAAHAFTKVALHGGVRPKGEDRTGDYSGESQL